MPIAKLTLPCRAIGFSESVLYSHILYAFADGRKMHDKRHCGKREHIETQNFLFFPFVQAVSEFTSKFVIRTCMLSIRFIMILKRTINRLHAICIQFYKYHIHTMNITQQSNRNSNNNTNNCSDVICSVSFSSCLLSSKKIIIMNNQQTSKKRSWNLVFSQWHNCRKEFPSEFVWNWNWNSLFSYKM